MSNGKKKRVPKLNKTEPGHSTRTKKKKHPDDRIGWNTNKSRKIYERDFVRRNETFRNMKNGIKNNVRHVINCPDDYDRVDSIRKYRYSAYYNPYCPGDYTSMENRAFDRMIERNYPQPPIINDNQHTYAKSMHLLNDSGKNIEFIYNIHDNNKSHLGELTIIKKITKNKSVKRYIITEQCPQ
jgi:hypothetical protein